MKNNEQKFFLYLKDKMNPTEKSLFEDELKKSKELSKEFKEYKNVADLVSETKDFKLARNYTNSLVPDFRNRLEERAKQNYSKNFKYIFASLVIILSSYLIVSQFDMDSKTDLNQILTSLSANEIKSISNDFYLSNDLTTNLDEFSSEKIDSIYNSNFDESVLESIDNSNTDLIFTSYNSININEYLSDTEVDLIYSKLIEKKIL